MELALTLPVVAALLLAVAQMGLILRDHLLVVHAARAGVREAVVDARPGSVRAAALAASPALKPGGLRAETRHIRGSPDMVTVVVTYQSTTAVPLVGPLLPDVRLSAKASLQDETDT